MQRETSKRIVIDEFIHAEEIIRWWRLGVKHTTIAALSEDHSGLTALVFSLATEPGGKHELTRGQLNELTNALVDARYELLNSEFPT